MSTDPSPEAVAAALVVYLRKEFRIDEGELTPHARLVTTGLLDSVALVQLATWLEREFEITIPDQDIDADHLDSVTLMVEYVLARIRG